MNSKMVKTEPVGNLKIKKPNDDCVMYCNISTCNLPLINEGLICACGHVFCGNHKPWMFSKTLNATCGFYCLLCTDQSLDDRKVINLHDSRHVQTHDRGLVGVEIKLAISLVKHSVNTWMVQSRLQLKRQVQIAKEVHAEKQRRLMECRAATAAMLERSSLLKMYLGKKQKEEKQYKDQAEIALQRLSAVKQAGLAAKERQSELIHCMETERRRKAQLVSRLEKADEDYKELMGAFERIRRSASELREILIRRQQQNIREQRESRPYRQSRQRHRSHDRRELRLDSRGHREHREHQRDHREHRSRSRVHRNGEGGGRMVPLPACVGNAQHVANGRRCYRHN
ncbi:hypothetical protein BOX15_Mlig025336g1 [Macrostomum lignano]|uniref:Uncharacterized protein n=2 Tax=Macrostomum lignano TaxID=282301 RepID=A0A267ETU8_9PLAT|nr:hypothetical protein BOX15_Mlig025336g2 [Macrostomum lignano]PAA68402.1 hypothetical protein BOX15_Mlig025336g1 [Macrostomum lignano]